MADFDLFNGDADGIFSLLQLRQVDPRPNAERITGVKRDIKLLSKIVDQVGPGDRVTALDISMTKNSDALQAILAAGADVLYIDHHQADHVPNSPSLTVLLSQAKESCTAFLVDRHLKGAKSAWAVCGAYGDNFQALAVRIAKSAGLDLPMGRLRELGELINYNAYGLALEDLHFHPSALFEGLFAYPGPVAFLEDDPEVLRVLKDGYKSDWDVAHQARELSVTDSGQVLVLPAKSASNRISGLFGNALVDEEPHKAFAVLTELGGDTAAFRVSIRSPRKNNSASAAELARQFGGGGRSAAAGIDHLPEKELDRFIDAFRKWF